MIRKISSKNFKRFNQLKSFSASSKSASIFLVSKNIILSNNNNLKKHTINFENTYFEIPYTYNDTVIKVLAQNPFTLYIYWDINDKDRLQLIEHYGNDIFSKTRPFLIIKNETTGNYFDIEINDFANNWYVNVVDTKCKYTVTLVRKFIGTNNEYIPIVSSNIIESPNDHVLLEEMPDIINFVNVKNNTKSYLNIQLPSDKPIYKSVNKIYNTYKDIKKDNFIGNPSSFFNTFNN